MVGRKFFFPSFILRRLASLQFAIGLLFLIAFSIAIGTVFEQDQSLIFYKTNYPETNPIFGFIDWRLIFLFSLNQIYTSYWFLIMLFVFAASLISCTFTTQLPALKKFKLWQFFKYSRQFKKLNSLNPVKSSSNNITYKFYKQNYHLFRQGNKNYAYAGLLGRIGPIIVHFSILFLIIGSIWSALSGYTSQQIIPRGEIFHLQNFLKFGKITRLPQVFTWRVNDFWITYTNELKTNQFYSDLSLLNDNGFELKRKTIFVNEPFVYNDTTIYQTDWDILGLKVVIDDNKTIQIPLRKINTNGKKFWIGSIPVDMVNEKSISYTVLVNDLYGTILIYNEQGNLIQECLIGQTININFQTMLKFSELLTTTGLQIKTDNGLPLVYGSFLLLMISTYLSFISYSQVWEIEGTDCLIVGGRSNRAVLFFQEELRRLLQKSKSSV